MSAKLLLACALLVAGQREDFAVNVVEREGEWWSSVSATRVELAEIVQALALRMGTEIEGLAHLPQGVRVTVELHDRPIHQVLARILGSAGLVADVRSHAIYVRPLDTRSMNAAELREQALAAYLRALREFPDHPAAAHGRLAQARIEESRGALDAALGHYKTLLQRHHDSEVLPEALLRCGELLMQRKEWTQASQRFTDLLRLDRRHPFEIQARLDLARCSAQLDDHERAFYMLDVLETYAPTLEPVEIQARLSIRARALLAAGRLEETLAALEQIEKLGARSAHEVELHELRARALEAAGTPQLASRAWLACGQRLEGPERANAFVQAARTALEAGDSVGALFLVTLAKSAGAGETANTIEETVRAGLTLASRAPEGAEDEPLERAERLIAAGLGAETATTLRGLFEKRESFDEARRVRVAVAFARALAAREDLELAIGALKTVVSELEHDAGRRTLYVTAGELYEQHERLDDAILAYQGRL